ncbi:MAG TPA: hypothetical protein DIT64_12250 [Verrucomicrobiales bacterium]|nr:hypothetical protein [Verrucomicrobiales bacterium]HCN79274.1 hypothetical protein [Verrucomicrobiales bacterium]HRJ10087.1 hypothetical protein [Prosthecobacter sp.]HRK14276.1 hypothetical protein [Prosthecobacter sp.]
MIHGLLDATQVVATVELDGAPHEVCCEAEASHDRRTNLLTVRLHAFVRAMEQDHIGETATPAWLPEPETVTESVDLDEAHEMAEDIFASWNRRVLAALPRNP